MDNNKRSNQYNWFKGDNAPENKRKNNAKQVWKFTRIFIYLALFVFTMTGCVQSFVIKTDNKVGKGVEFYTSTNDVTPHVSVFKLDQDNTNGNVYELTIDEKKQIWVNDWPQSGTALADTRKAISNITGGKKMEDAYRGGNEAMSIYGTGVNTEVLDGTSKLGPVLKGQILYQDNKVNSLPVVNSSLVDKPKSGATAVALNLNKVYFYNGGHYIEVDLSKTLKGVENINTANQVNTLLDIQLTSQIRLGKWIEDQIGTNTYVTATNLQPNETQVAAMESLSTIMSYAGINMKYNQSIAGIGNTTATLSYSTGYVPGIGSGENAYRPLVTWGDNWKLGPFYGIFVYPISAMANGILNGLGDMNGWETVIALFITVWIVRMITFALSFKSILQQTKTQELQGKKAVIDAKYAGYKGNKQMEQRQRAEVSELYKKEGINPLSSLGSIFLTMPFFLTMWRVIGGIPHIKAIEWLNISFGATSWRELFAGSFQYLPLIIFAAFFAGAQQIIPRLLTRKRNNTRINVQQKAAMKKNNRTQNIMLFVFIAMAVIFNAGLQIYWIAGGIWMVGQSIATHYIIQYQHKKNRRKKVRV